jgi:hypothetical protein
MSTNPNPNKVYAIFYRERPVTNSSPNGPKPPHFLEMKRGMPRVLLQQLEILFRCPLDGFREIVKALPETACGAMDLEFLQVPLGFFIKGFLD